MNLFSLVFSYFKYYKVKSIITTLSLTISLLLITISYDFHKSVSESFKENSRGIDLIISEKGSSLEHLLFTVFHIGVSQKSIPYEVYLKYKNSLRSNFLIPFTLGDNYKNFPAMGVEPTIFSNYFQNYLNPQVFKFGSAFTKPNETVIGSEVAKKLHLKIGDIIHLGHGTQSIEKGHEEHPFYVIGILNETKSTFDKNVYIPLNSYSILHEIENEVHEDHENHHHEENNYHKTDTQIENFPRLSGIFVGLKNNFDLLMAQNRIEKDTEFSLSAVMTAWELSKLNSFIGTSKNALFMVSLLMALTTLLNLFLSQFESLRMRTREFALLKIQGFKALKVGYLLILDSLFIGVISYIFHLVFRYTFYFFFAETIYAEYNINLFLSPIGEFHMLLLIGILASLIITSLVPAIIAIRKTKNSGLDIKNDL